MHPAKRGVREDVGVDVPQLVQHPHRAMITGQQALNDVEFPLVFHVPNLMQLCLQGHIHGCTDLRIGHLISDDDVRVAPVLSEVILERHREAPEQLHRLQLRIDHAIVVGALGPRDSRQNSARQAADLVDHEAPLGARICVAAVACLRLERDKQPQGDGGHRKALHGQRQHPMVQKDVEAVLQGGDGILGEASQVRVVVAHEAGRGPDGE
mmetsp:Transcript_143290/g.457873  ORF Transcript_143290/g.457873 Transcript_143290/m.457873 type:complete len:210 (-) Transcript_143290:428-1057(-)